jgi:PEP-CTERM motif-containing protein
MKHPDSDSLVSIVVLLFLALWLATPPTVRADTITITGGSLQLSGSQGSMSLIGDSRGFTLSGGGDALGGVIGLHSSPFRPGDTMPLAARWSGGDLLGGFTLDGVTYFSSGVFPICGGNCGYASVDFEGTAVAPPFGNDLTTTLVEPFTFSGNVMHLVAPPSFQTESDSLIGQGLATIHLSQIPGGSGPLWIYTTASYDFAVAPEPGTLVLFGAGLVGVGLRRWRQHRARQERSEGAP